MKAPMPELQGDVAISVFWTKMEMGLRVWSGLQSILSSAKIMPSREHPRLGRGLANSPLLQIGYSMAQVKSGDTVRIHYTGTLVNGETFDSTIGQEPLEFIVGSGQVIPGLDAALPGMNVGDKKTVQVPVDQAYGQPHDDARQAVPRSEIPADIPLETATQLQMQTPQGQVLPVQVVKVTEEQVLLDANHPLAGQDLTFAIELMSIG